MAAAGGLLDAALLRKQLSARLPEALVPSEIVILDAIPLTPSGKVDRRALGIGNISGSKVNRITLHDVQQPPPTRTAGPVM